VVNEEVKLETLDGEIKRCGNILVMAAAGSPVVECGDSLIEEGTFLTLEDMTTGLASPR